MLGLYKDTTVRQLRSSKSAVERTEQTLIGLISNDHKEIQLKLFHMARAECTLPYLRSQCQP